MLWDLSFLVTIITALEYVLLLSLMIPSFNHSSTYFWRTCFSRTDRRGLVQTGSWSFSTILDVNLHSLIWLVIIYQLFDLFSERSTNIDLGGFNIVDCQQSTHSALFLFLSLSLGWSRCEHSSSLISCVSIPSLTLVAIFRIVVCPLRIRMSICLCKSFPRSIFTSMASTGTTYTSLW